MGALRELSSLLAENAELLTNKVAVLASLCPPPGVLKLNAVKVTARHMNGILAIAQFLAQSDGGQHREQLFEVVLEFLRSVPTLTKSCTWPSTFSAEAASGYFPELLSYVVKIADSDTKAAQDVSNVIAGVIQQVSAGGDVEGVLSSCPGAKAFVAALGKICPNLRSSDSEQIIVCLLDHWIPSSQSGALVISSSEASGTGSPLRSYLQAPYRNGFKTPRKSSESDGFEQADSKGVSPSSESRNHVTFFSPNSTVSATPIFTPISTPLKLSGEQTPVVRSGSVSGPIDEEGDYGRLPVPSLKGAFDGAPGFRRHQSGLAIESVCALEKQEIAYRLLTRILERAETGSTAKILHIQQLRTNTIRQLKSLLPVLKIRKRDWTTDVLELEAKVNMMFQASQAASVLQVKCIFQLDSDGKLLKAALRESLPLLMDAADACISSPWRRRSKGCEDLFASLITGVAHIAALHRSQMQRILLRFKVLVLTACAQANTWGTTLGSSFESIIRGSCILIEVGWKSDRPAVESFLLSLAAQIREKDKGERASQGAAMMQLNVISFLADLSISLNKPEVVELILPIFVESLEEGDAASPSLLRLKLLEAVGRMACLGCEKSYREVVVLLTRSYLDKLSTVGSSLSRTTPPEGTTERLETLPAAFLQIARGLKQPALRMDYRQRLLALCSDVGLVAEAKNGRSGADLLGPLLSAVAEMSVDFDPTKDVDPSLLKLFRNLWFYIALFALAPPLQKGPLPSKSGAIVNHTGIGQSQAITAGLSMGFSTGSLPLQAVAGPYAWNPQWSAAAEKITQGTPPLVVSSVKWLEDELELNSLLNPGSSRGGYNDKASSAQRSALSAALGGRVETSPLSTISGVKATYLLAVAFLEVLRFRNCGGVLRNSSFEGEYTSALCFAFKYLETPSLTPAVQQCLVAIVHQAFAAVMSWLADRASAIGKDGEEREAVIVAHACFFIRITSHREEYIRELADALLNQLKSKFSQVLWNPRCLNELLLLATGSTSSASTSDFGSSAPRQLTHQKVREWIVQALLLVPCTMQGLLQEQLRKLNSWQSATSEVLSLLSEIRLDVTKADPHTGMACIPAVTAAAAAAAGVNPKLAQSGTVEVLSTGIISANIKSNYSGEIAGMKRLYVGMGGLAISPPSYVQNVMRVRIPYGPAKKDELQDSADHVQDLALNEMLTTKFVQQLQQFFTAAEKGLQVDAAAFREACLRGAALLLSDLGTCKEFAEGESHLLRLLCWCPAHVFTPETMETGVFVWTWILSAAPQLGSRVLGELVDAWMWTVDTRKGLFASGIENSGPAAKLRPELTPGEPGPSPNPDPVRGINAHRVWLGFLLDRFEVIRHGCSDQLLLFGRLLQGSISKPLQFTTHPAAAGAFFTLMLFSLKYCACQTQLGSLVERSGAVLLEDAVYRAGLSWFSAEPGWFDSNTEGFAQAEALTVTRFLQQLTNDRSDTTAQEEVTVSCAVRKRSQDFGLASTNGVAQMKAQLEAAQFLKAKVDGEAAMKERRKQLLLMLCQHEAERLDTWAYPLKESLPRWRVSADQWAEYVKTAWSVDPHIALSLVARFPGNGILRTEVSSLVQGHVQDLFDIPEALPYIVTPRAVEENSAVLQKLSHWAPCSITCALEFLTPPYKGHPRVMAYVLRVLETYPPERVTFFMPQLVQSLRYDHGGLVEGYLLGAAQISNLFAHILIWQLQGEEAPSSEEAIKEPPAAAKGNLYEIVPRVRKRIIDGFSPEAYDVFLREFRFFDKVTSISGALYPLHKDERRAAIRRELEKIEVEGEDLYLPTDPDMLVRGIKLDSGIPLQSAAKVPIMITFDVVDKNGDHSDVKAQACIFKVGDDCRQDVLALQVIALMRNIFEAVGLNLYLFPYGVLPTGYGRGIIEVVPDTRSRNQMGEITDGGLYEIFQQEYGPIGFPGFEKARDNFIISSAGYAVASLLLQPKDRHNGNLLFDSEGRLVHIDFGFILETSPGGNIRFESAQFKLSHEMTQLLDPSGSMKSETWYRFVSLCVKGYLAARKHMDGIINTVLLMVDSGLPCFSRGDPIGNLRKRFHPEMNEREAANFMIKTCKDAYNKWTTAGYDLIQHIQQGIEM